MDKHLQYDHFISWACENEAFSPYQIEIKIKTMGRKEEGNKDELNYELGSNFLSYIYLNPSPSEVRTFLEFQFVEYKHNKRDFIDFLKKVLTIPISEDVQHSLTEEILQIRRKDIKEWIKEKKNDPKLLNPNGNSKNKLYFSDYLSFICGRSSDEEKKKYENYQLICNTPEGKNCEPLKSESCLKGVNLLLEHDYYHYLFNAFRPNQCHEFLDFHFKMYNEKNPGQWLNFFSFVQDTLSLMKYSKNPTIRAIVDDPGAINRMTLINKWIEDKRKELLAEAGQSQTKSKKRTPQGHNEFNKPVLNQKQTAILFKLFFDHNLFVITTLRKNKYEEILSQLTGWSENTFHQVFSVKGSDLLTISDNPDDYKKIISELQGIIEKLKENIV